ncbi:accessory gene regulator B family protein [Oscillospiraceae bacterium OttesenSCG-928-F05]|nr:accessory gene regulator B family protein [Oscillospiraceae bacterium OttesenSCG-928-F05]
MELLSKKLGRLIRARGISGEDEDVLSYGLFIFLAGAEQLVILLAIALLFGFIFQMACFVLCYSLLKRNIGGWHTQGHAACVVCYTLLATAMTFLSTYLPGAVIIPVSAVCVLFAVVVIWIRAPVEHPNRPLSPEVRIKLRRAGRGAAAALSVCVTAALVAGGSTGAGRYALCGALGMMAAASTLLIPIRLSSKEDQFSEEGGEKHEEV